MKPGLLDRFAGVVLRRPLIVVLISLSLASAAVILSVFFLRAETGRQKLLSEKGFHYRNFVRYTEEFGPPYGLILVAKGPSPEVTRRFLDALAPELLAERSLIDEIFYKTQLDFFKQNALLYMDRDAEEKAALRIAFLSDLLQKLPEKADLSDLLYAMDREILRGLKRRRAEDREAPGELKALARLLRGIEGALGGERIEPIDSFLPVSEESARYITSSSGKAYYMFLRPSREDIDVDTARTLVERVRAVTGKIQATHPGVYVGLTGKAAFIYDEMEASRRDITRLSVVAFFAVGTMLLLTFRTFTEPLLALFSLIIAIAWTFGLTTMAVGHLNILSMVFAIILIGMGVDFGIHLVSRFLEERADGREILTSIRRALTRTGGGILIGAVTTALAFFVTMIGNLKGIAELGFISGAGILLCLLSMMSVLPAMILLCERLRLAGRRLFFRQPPLPPSALTPPRRHLVTRHPVTALFLCLAILLALLWKGRSVGFDANLLHLQASGTESVRLASEMVSASAFCPQYGVLIARGFREARRFQERVSAFSSVGHVESVLSFLPSGQEERLRWIRSIRPAVETMRVPTEREVRRKRLLRALGKMGGHLGMVEKRAREAGGEGFAGEVASQIARIEGITESCGTTEVSVVEARLNAFQFDVFDALRSAVAFLQGAVWSRRITPADLPVSIRNRFISPRGGYLLYVFPQGNIWDEEVAARFVGDLRTVSLSATGIPVTSYEGIRQVLSGYRRAGLFAGVAMLLLLLVDFRSWRAALFAFLPLLVGLGGLLGLMALLRIPFNPANLIAFPLILGIGVDNGIHLVHRYRETRTPDVDLILHRTGRAVVITSLTTILSFGCLGFASHRGTASLGITIALGVFACLIASLTVLPALLQLAKDRSWRV